MAPATIDPILYVHQTKDRAAYAVGAHLMMQEDPSTRPVAEENILAARFLYRDVLERILSGVITVNIDPERYAREVVRAHETSDFDWCDCERLRAFLADIYGRKTCA